MEIRRKLQSWTQLLICFARKQSSSLNFLLGNIPGIFIYAFIPSLVLSQRLRISCVPSMSSNQKWSGILLHDMASDTLYLHHCLHAIPICNLFYIACVCKNDTREVSKRITSLNISLWILKSGLWLCGCVSFFKDHFSKFSSFFVCSLFVMTGTKDQNEMILRIIPGPFPVRYSLNLLCLELCCKFYLDLWGAVFSGNIVQLLSNDNDIKIFMYYKNEQKVSFIIISTFQND